MKRLIFTVLAQCFIAIKADALTLTQIRSQIRKSVDDVPATQNLRKYSNTVLLTWINDAQREIVNLTWCIQKSTSYVLTAATTFYALPTDFIAVVQGKALFQDNGGQQYQLQEFSEAKIYETEPDFANTSQGPPTHYFIRYPGDSDDTLEISYLPVPTTTSTGTVTAWYYNSATDLSSDSDVPFEGFNHLIPYHWAIVYHVVSKIKALESKPTEADFYLKEFDRVVTTMSDRLGRAPNRSPSAQGQAR